ncbi:hypothetical protein L596_015078 [Steinernema carpocapsae]|uniref:Uncharacterized protein n=1 Tax=Steinernema carpocapsae TaxID=34508 RepID=A0A4U5NEU7_STECR|nr:hypothetical protein L596_015078 [Steinernema carpocapsae]
MRLPSMLSNAFFAFLLLYFCVTMDASVLKKTVHEDGTKDFTIVKVIKKNQCTCSCHCVPQEKVDFFTTVARVAEAQKSTITLDDLVKATTVNAVLETTAKPGSASHASDEKPKIDRSEDSKEENREVPKTLVTASTVENDPSTTTEVPTATEKEDIAEAEVDHKTITFSTTSPSTIKEVTQASSTEPSTTEGGISSTEKPVKTETSTQAPTTEELETTEASGAEVTSGGDDDDLLATTPTAATTEAPESTTFKEDKDTTQVLLNSEDIAKKEAKTTVTSTRIRESTQVASTTFEPSTSAESTTVESTADEAETKATETSGKESSSTSDSTESTIPLKVTETSAETESPKADAKRTTIAGSFTTETSASTQETTTETKLSVTGRAEISEITAEPESEEGRTEIPITKAQKGESEPEMTTFTVSKASSDDSAESEKETEKMIAKAKKLGAKSTTEKPSKETRKKESKENEEDDLGVSSEEDEERKMLNSLNASNNSTLPGRWKKLLGRLKTQLEELRAEKAKKGEDEMVEKKEEHLEQNKDEEEHVYRIQIVADKMRSEEKEDRNNVKDNGKNNKEDDVGSSDVKEEPKAEEEKKEEEATTARGIHSRTHYHNLSGYRKDDNSGCRRVHHHCCSQNYRDSDDRNIARNNHCYGDYGRYNHENARDDREGRKSICHRERDNVGNQEKRKKSGDHNKGRRTYADH